MVSSTLEKLFPRLAGSGYSVTSPQSQDYNCIAWAAGDTKNCWWPVSNVEEAFWPANVTRAETISAFRDAFASLGYLQCKSDEPEPGFEKVALFADERGIPRHAARQLPRGRWTSKLGELEDIEHGLRDLEGAEYGTVVLILRRSYRGSCVRKLEPGDSIRVDHNGARRHPPH